MLATLLHVAAVATLCLSAAAVSQAAEAETWISAYKDVGSVLTQEQWQGGACDEQRHATQGNTVQPRSEDSRGCCLICALL